MFDAAGNVIEVVTDIGRAGELNAQLGTPALNSYSNIPPNLAQAAGLSGVGAEDQKTPSPEEGGGDAEAGESDAEESQSTEDSPVVARLKRGLGGTGKLIEDYVPPIAQMPGSALSGVKTISGLAEGAVDPVVGASQGALDATKRLGSTLASAGKQALTPKKGLPPIKKNVEAIRTSAEDLVQRMDTPQVAEMMRKRLMNLAKGNRE